MNRLEQVIDAVRQGQTKGAPIERIVDVVTSYFVPLVTGLAITTWIVWLSLGLSGELAADNLANSVGGSRTSYSYFWRILPADIPLQQFDLLNSLSLCLSLHVHAVLAWTLPPRY
jgi:hypothetical protein